MPASAVVAGGTYLLWRLIIYLYAFAPIFGPIFFLPRRPPPEVRQAEQFGLFMAYFGMPAIFFLLAVGAALWVGRRVGRTALLHGALLGAISTALYCGVIVPWAFPPLTLQEVLIYLPLGIGGGLLGGLRGWVVRSGAEALRETSRDVAAARSPRSIAAAVGERLAGADVSDVSVWQAHATDGGAEDGAATPEGLGLLASWAPGSATGGGAVRPWPPGSRLRLGRHLRGLFERPVALVVEELPVAERAAWEERGARSALFVPLVGPGGAWSGALVVSSRRGGRGSFSPGVRRAYSTVGAQAATVLENISLVEEARRAGLLGERRRLAGEIHDTLAQSFTSVVTNLEAAEAALRTDPAVVHRHLDRARSTARDGLAEARRLVWALKPPLLEGAALPEALGRLAARWSEATGVTASASATGDEARPLAPQVEATLFRAAQEALNNVGKHADASRVALTLSYVGDRVVLDVLDDGRGFDPGSVRSVAVGNGHRLVDGGGFGLAAMRERVEALGGALTVESARGEGTTLVVELPAGNVVGPE